MSKSLLQSSIDELDSIIVREYQLAVKYIYSDIVDTYMTILGEDDKPLMSHLYKYNRDVILYKKINNRLKELGKIEEIELSKAMKDLYKKNEKVIGKEFNLSTHIDEDKLKDVIKKDWVGDGKNYSDRIWNNQAQMQVKLKQIINQSIIQGKTPTKFSADLKQYLVKEGDYPIRRLLRTEMARIQLRSSLDKYKEAGIKKIKIVEFIDKRTCDECIARNGKVLEIKDIDENKILAHPQCRASISPVI